MPEAVHDADPSDGPAVQRRPPSLVVAAVVPIARQPRHDTHWRERQPVEGGSPWADRRVHVLPPFDDE